MSIFNLFKKPKQEGKMKQIRLGEKYTDSVTKYSGIAIGRCVYLTGCVQVLLIPDKLTKDGKRPDGGSMKTGLIRIS